LFPHPAGEVPFDPFSLWKIRTASPTHTHTVVDEKMPLGYKEMRIEVLAHYYSERVEFYDDPVKVSTVKVFPDVPAPIPVLVTATIRASPCGR
jgi:hypothetical protein